MGRDSIGIDATWTTKWRYLESARFDSDWIGCKEMDHDLRKFTIWILLNKHTDSAKWITVHREFKRAFQNPESFVYSKFRMNRNLTLVDSVDGNYSCWRKPFYYYSISHSLMAPPTLDTWKTSRSLKLQLITGEVYTKSKTWPLNWFWEKAWSAGRNGSRLIGPAFAKKTTWEHTCKDSALQNGLSRK